MIVSESTHGLVVYFPGGNLEKAIEDALKEYKRRYRRDPFSCEIQPDLPGASDLDGKEVKGVKVMTNIFAMPDSIHLRHEQ